MVGIGQELSRGGADIEALGIATFVLFAASTRDNFPIEYSLGVLLSPVVILVDCDRDKFVLQELDDGGVCEDRRTVDDAVVSDAGHGVAIHRPDEQGLPLFARFRLSV